MNRRKIMAKSYASKRDAAAARQRKLSLSGRDIGELPAVAKPNRRAQAAESLRYFAESYFAERFTLKWSNDHLTVLNRIETAVREGGLFAMAMPRGSGKTTIVEVSALWALVAGYRQFVAVIGADETSSLELLASMKIEMEVNDDLAADWPEVCYPIRALEGIAHRCRGQLYRGERTRILWTGKTLVLPTIPGSKASGAIVKVAGITGRIRGMKHARVDGHNVRPDLVIVDDPQTDESARSPSQCERREQIVAGAILGLAGPGKKIAGVLPCTVVVKGDFADRVLDRKLHPAWCGERLRMIYAMPTAADLWAKYAEIRAEELAAGRGLAAATEFYRKHRKQMDAGARVGWPARFNRDELSALQHAMNLYFQSPDAFLAEYQNDPPDRTADAELLSVDAIAGKTNGYGRGEVPQEATHLTAFVDVQSRALYYAVVAWSAAFTGYVVDYGTWPEQRERYYTLSSIRNTLARAYPGRGREGQIFAGLVDLAGELLARKWTRDDKAELSLERLLIDANWGESTAVVYQVVRQSSHRTIVYPSHGRGITATDKPMREWSKREGEQVGLEWRIRQTTEKRANVRHVMFDTNYWKSFIHARLSVAMGDAGSLSLFKGRAGEHRMIAEHLRAEDRNAVESNGRRVDQWRLKPGGPDNHFFDCLVGAAVGASMAGCRLAEHAPPVAARTKARRRGVSYLH